MQRVEFCPTDPIRRDQTASLLARALGAEPTHQLPGVADVSAFSVHVDGIAALRQRRILRGCTATDFCPADHLSRAQAASLLARAFPAEPA